MSDHPLFIKDLQLHLSGDVLTDIASLGIYATDASLYQIEPVAVVLPKDEQDVISAVAIARDHQISILPRGGGTSLAGQTVGKSMVLDFSKYMNQVLEYKKDQRWIRVQPGIVRDVLNDFVYNDSLHFAPDPATSSRANIGGMIGNNSSGTKSILYGKTVDHLIALKVLLADGSILQLENNDKDLYAKKCQLENREGEIYSGIKSFILENEAAITERFPKVMRRVQGYNLDEFGGKDDWNLAKLICGSEGTLAVILEATVKLEPLPRFKSVCVVHFKEMQEAIRAVAPMLAYTPAAVEILDDTVIKMSRSNLATKRHASFIEGNPGSVQLVEFYGDTAEEVMDRPRQMVAELKRLRLGYAYPIFSEGPSYHDAWMIRKKGLGLMLGEKGNKKPIAFIEDASIPIDVLPEYIEQVVAICDKYQTRAAVYAHASVGVIHVRPILDMRLQEDIDRFKHIADETFELVKHYGGSWSGEHGDGLVRSFYLERYFGEEVYQILREVKALFDPEGLMNPGKIIDAPPIDHDLRYGVAYEDEELETVYHYRSDGSFGDAVHMCSGVGECRKTIGGTMCPSYRATMDEEHSTRGRANALRLAMSGQLDDQGLTSPRLKEVLDLCLSCKACKSECPSNVDMAKLKSEVLQKHYDANGSTLRDRLISGSSGMAAAASGPLAPLINRVMHSGVSRNILDSVAGLDKRRKAPSYAHQSFISWYKTHYKNPQKHKRQVVLFADTYLNYHEPTIGIAATKLLYQCGYDVVVEDLGCCQRPKISHGYLKDAKSKGKGLMEHLGAHVDKGRSIIVCEPSCHTALVDDLADLIDNHELAESVQEHVYSLDTFVAQHLKSDDHTQPILSTKSARISLHGHCHQKAFTGTQDVLYILQEHARAVVTEIPSGCCGMAGSFGYEKEHYDLSIKIADQILVPAIQVLDEEVLVVANGFSCRHQISDCTDRSAVHWVQALNLQ